MKSGFVSILGRPNAGKSTLLNYLIGEKIAIVANKPQTTRNAIQGVMNAPDAQIVFLDTPGIHKADSLLNKRMMDTVRAALEERDLLLFLVDATRRFGEEDRHAAAILKRTETPSLLVLNKTDLLGKNKGALLPLIEHYKALHEFVDFIPISAQKGDGVDDLRKAIVDRLPEGPAYFPPDYITDQPERFLAAEFIREKVLEATRQEVPHSVAVMVDAWEDTPKLIRIFATIHVEKNGQKGIIIGAGGAMLKQIGTLAREEMEGMFGRKIYLDLRVKVMAGWRERPDFLEALDWRTMSGTDEI
ncbi:MAG: GTPase Era [Bryobacteraceae bacterium]